MKTELRFATLWDRIEHRLNALGINQAEAARRSGFKNDSDFRNIKSGRTREPKSIKLAKIAVALETTEAWLREELGPEDRNEACDPLTAETGDALVKEAHARAVRLAELFAATMKADPQAQSRLIELMEAEIKSPAVANFQFREKSARSKSRG
jgi:hypothetical protein